MTLSPIVLFVYKRPGHTKRMIESLKLNPEYSRSLISVYCDGAKDVQEQPEVLATRDIVQELLPGANFIESDVNLGLAASIIRGVTEQCEIHERVIVFEDDLVMSPVTLRYFNEALEFYRNHDKVMHVSAYMYPVKEELPSTFFFHEASCWGWATWKRAWDHFEPNTSIIIDHLLKYGNLKKFNTGYSYLYWKMLLAQAQGKIDSWAIRWYGSVFMNNGLALHPACSYTQNTGFDGTGVHCSTTKEFEVDLSNEVPIFSDNLDENSKAVNSIIKYRGKYNSLFDNRIQYYVSMLPYILKRSV